MSILKPSILADIPGSQQRFLWYSQNSFQLNPSFFLNIYHHGPHLHRLFWAEWLKQSTVYICPWLICLHRQFSLLHLPWSKIMEKNSLVWFISSIWICLQLLCHNNQTGLISCLKYDERKQKQRHLSQILKSSTYGIEGYNLCISHNKSNLFTEIWINVLTCFSAEIFWRSYFSLPCWKPTIAYISRKIVFSFLLDEYRSCLAANTSVPGI